MDGFTRGTDSKVGKSEGAAIAHKLLIIVVNEDEWIKVVGTEWQQSLNIVFAIEILLKYHLISHEVHTLI